MANVFAHSLADDLSYEDIIDDVVIFSDGSVGIGYAIDTVYIDNMDLGELLTLERSLSAFLLGIDKDVSVQVQWRKVAGKIPALDNHLDSIETGDPIVQQMCENRHEFWSRRRDLKAVFGFNCEIWFRKMYPRSFQGKFNEIWDMGVDEDRLVVKYMKEQNEIAENFRALTERIMVPFKSVAGRGVHQMNADEIYFSIRSFLTGDYHNVYEYKYDKPLKERFRGIDVSRKWGYFTIGNKDEKIFSILSVRDLPDRSQMMLINYLLDIDAEFCITVNIAAIDQGIKKDQLRKQFRRQMSVLNSKIDPELGTQAGEVSQLLQELQSGSNDLMDFEMFITITESNLKKLDFIVKHFISHANSKMGIRLEQEKAALWPIFKVTVPGWCICGTVSRHWTVKTENIADFLPLYGPMKSSSKSVMLLGAPYQSLYGYDPFDSRLPANNMLIFGGTGSGKSFTANLMMASMAAQNPLIFIVDKGGSYKSLVNILGGTYIDMSSRDNMVSFNPLEGKKDWKKKERMYRTILGECIKTSANDEITAYEDTLLTRWVNALFTRFTQDPKYMGREPTFSDAYTILESNRMYKEDEPLAETQRKMLACFSKWTKAGSRNQSVVAEYIDNEKTNITLNTDVVAFDLLGIEKNPELMGVVFLTISNMIMNKVTDPALVSKPKIIVFDECWSYLKSKMAADFINELYRTMRKYKAMVVSISQNIMDFANSAVSDALLSNTYQTIVLKQAQPTLADKIGDLMGLNSSEIDIIKGLQQSPGQYSQIFLKLAQIGSGLMCIMPSPGEYWLATTRADDKKIRDQYIAQGYSINKTIAMLSEKYPNGYFG